MNRSQDKDCKEFTAFVNQGVAGIEALSVGKGHIKTRTLFWKWIVVMIVQHCECTNSNSFCRGLFFKCGIKQNL